MVQEALKTKTLEELKGLTLEDLLHEVVRSRKPLRVVLEEGEVGHHRADLAVMGSHRRKLAILLLLLIALSLGALLL
jgi:hypothetical protein